MDIVEQIRNARNAVKEVERERAKFISHIDETLSDFHQRIYQENVTLQRMVEQLIISEGIDILTNKELVSEIYSVLWNDGQPNQVLLHALFSTLPTGLYFARPNYIHWSFQGVPDEDVPTPCFMLEIPENPDMAILDATWDILGKIFVVQTSVNSHATLLISHMGNRTANDFNVFTVQKSTNHRGYVLSSESLGMMDEITAVVNSLSPSRKNFAMNFAALAAALNFAVQNVGALMYNKAPKRDRIHRLPHGFVEGFPVVR